jgi:hypothetical protein
MSDVSGGSLGGAHRMGNPAGGTAMAVTASSDLGHLPPYMLPPGCVWDGDRCVCVVGGG